MGMYDTIYMSCPYCGQLNDAQTKSGPCNLGDYDLNENIPAASGLVGTIIVCEHCREKFTVDRYRQPVFETRKLKEEEQDLENGG